MAHATGPRNRKERRAQIQTQPTIPLSQPSRSTPVSTNTSKPKTLYEIAAEHQQSLLLETSSPSTAQTSNTNKSPAHTTLRINPDGTLSTISHPSLPTPPRPIPSPPISANNDHEKDPLGPFATALFLSTTLSTLHFTLDVLVHHQYRQTIAWSEITRRTAGALPLLLLLLTTTNALLPAPHPHSAQRIIPVRQSLFLALALLCGAYLLHITHEAAYYAVLKRAPAVGTVWVWSVVELEPYWALGSVLGVGAWGWWWGYGVF